MSFEVENGVLKSYTGNDKTVTIPTGITEISDKAFNDVKSIECIIISEGTEIIGTESFYGCEKLECVKLPSTIKKIGSRAFCRCHGIKRVYVADVISWCKIEGGNGDGNITWNPLHNGATLYVSDKPLEKLDIPHDIVGISAGLFYNCSSLSTVSIHKNVLSIGEKAFGKCKNLQVISFEDGIKEIGAEAFIDCQQLQSITIPNSVTFIGQNAFTRCEQVHEITISKSIEKLEDSCFSVCKNIREIVVPENVSVIGKNAFYQCVNLKKITLPSSLNTIQQGAFFTFGSISREVHISSLDAWISIDFETVDSNPLNSGGDLFCGGAKISSLDGLNGKVQIKAFSFTGCNNFSSLIIPAGISEIKDGAFCKCGYLREVSIPSGVISIGKNAFSDCGALKKVEISNPSTITEQGAFANCGVLSEISIPIGNGQIQYAVFNRCRNLKKIVIPEGIVSIESNAFSGCGVQEVVFPSTLKEIKYAAFYKSNLNTVELPEGISIIEKSSFSDCAYLKSVKLSSTIKELIGEVFPNCTSLEKVFVLCNISALTKDTFAKCPALSEVYISEDQVEDARDYFSKKVKYYTLEGTRIGKPEKPKSSKPAVPKPNQNKSKETTQEKDVPDNNTITIEYIDGTKPNDEQVETIQYTGSIPKGFTKPGVKEVFINQNGKDFSIVFKTATKLSTIWKRFYMMKDNGHIYDPSEALQSAYQSGGYIDDGSGEYVSCPLQGNIPQNVKPLSAAEIEKRLRAFVTVVHACSQEKTIEKIFFSLPKKKNGMLHKGRVVHIGYLDLVDDDGSTFEITAKNEDDSQALIEIRSNVPVVNDLLQQDRLFIIHPDNPLLTSEEYAIIREEERKKQEAERLAERQRKEAERLALQQEKQAQREAEKQAKIAEREAEKRAREEAQQAAREKRAREKAQWEYAKQLANQQITERKEEARRQRESEKKAAQQIAEEAREKRKQELQQARANATILYAPGEEPERLHKRIQTLLEKLNEAYPDHVIFNLGKDHKKWGETITEIYRQLGYADNRSFLEAYGFTMDDERGKGGRPVTLDATAVIAELQRRYPEGAGSMKLDELRAKNPDLPLKTLQNNANESFGMPLIAYLKSIGFIQGSTRSTNERQTEIDKSRVNRQAYNSGNLNKAAEAEQRYLNAIDALSQRLSDVHMSDIVDYLGVSKGSASESLKRLREKGLIIVEGRSIKKA